jgi:hypothetical protein
MLPIAYVYFSAAVKALLHPGNPHPVEARPINQNNSKDNPRQNPKAFCPAVVTDPSISHCMTIMSRHNNDIIQLTISQPSQPPMQHSIRQRVGPMAMPAWQPGERASWHSTS